MNKDSNFFQHFLMSNIDTKNCQNSFNEPVGSFYKYQASDPIFDTNIENLKEMDLEEVDKSI